jgi:hypothetical protein
LAQQIAKLARGITGGNSSGGLTVPITNSTGYATPFTGDGATGYQDTTTQPYGSSGSYSSGYGAYGQQISYSGAQGSQNQAANAGGYSPIILLGALGLFAYLLATSKKK